MEVWLACMGGWGTGGGASIRVLPYMVLGVSGGTLPSKELPLGGVKPVYFDGGGPRMELVGGCSVHIERNWWLTALGHNIRPNFIRSWRHLVLKARHDYTLFTVIIL